MIVDDGRRSWIGKFVEWIGPPWQGALRLHPAFVYLDAWDRVEGGRAMRRFRGAAPIEAMGSSPSVEIRPGSIIYFSEFDLEDQRVLMRIVEGAIQERAEARAKRTGIFLSGAS